MQVESDPDELRSQKRHEMKIAAPYRGHLEWRLVLQTVFCLGAWIGVIAAAAYGVLSYWIACPLNGGLAYLFYMTLHESTHGNVSGRHSKWRFMNDVVGSVSAIPLWLSYRAHRISHMQHHAYANDPERDPDHVLAGPLSHIPLKFFMLTLLQNVAPTLALVPGGLKLLPKKIQLARERRAKHEDPLECHYHDRFQRVCAAAFIVLSLAGFFREALWLWFVPSRIGFFLVAVVFGWLPHHPHSERGRYRDTRITLFPGATVLLRGQNHHLLHHMFPRVPHYRLPALFQEMRPTLEAQGARIEGPLAGTDAPPILLR